MGPIFFGGVDMDNISNKFEGQCRRSKVKVATLKNVIFEVLDGLTCVHVDSLCHVLWHHDVTVFGNTDKEGTMQEGALR